MKLRVAYGLLALSVVPLLGGAMRLAGMVDGDAAPTGDRFVRNPLPVVVHILTAGMFVVLGAVQFESDLRRAWPRWHRYAGRVLVPCGLLAAATGAWMTLSYTIPPELQGSLLFWVRLVVGGGMALALLLALHAILDRNLASHRAWMLRAYALGQGAGTQVLFLLPSQLLSGEAVTGRMRDLLMAAAWAANVLVAESLIRRGSHRAACPTPAPRDRRLAPPSGVSSQPGGSARVAAPKSPHAVASAVSESTP